MSNYVNAPFVSGMVPTTSQWNQLWVNDAAFHDGTAITALTIGTVTSVTNPVKFSVYRNAAWTSTNPTPSVVQFDTKIFDIGSNIDVVTNKGRFTAPIAGFYWFSAGINHSTAANTQLITYLYKNGSSTGMPILQVQEVTTTNNGVIVSGSAVVQLAANDYVEIYCLGGGGSAMGVGQNNTWFQGFLVSNA